MIKMIKMQWSFYVCVENTAMASSIKKWFVCSCVRVYMLRKSIESMCP